MIDDEMVAAAARMLWIEVGFSTPWDECPKVTREHYERKARRILEAAFRARKDGI